MQNPSESVNFKQDEGFPVQNAQKKVPNKKAAVPAAQQPLKSHFSFVSFASLAQERRQGLAFLAPLVIFRSGGKFHVTGGVQGSFHGILHHADDEADTDHLHGDIIGDAKQGAGHGDQQRRRHPERSSPKEGWRRAGTPECPAYWPQPAS